MTDPAVFWEPSQVNIEDPDWRVFEYNDGALEFICVDCQQSIWQDREVVSVETAGMKVQGHYSPAENSYAMFVNERHGAPPKEIDVFDDPPSHVDYSEPLLWAFLAGWSHANQGPPIECDYEPADFLEITGQLTTPVEESFSALTTEYSFEDYINVGVGLLTPGEPDLE